jgi:drug/metabolite transporter (DMT)-like permease
VTRAGATAAALCSAALFGASTPLARGLLGAIDPLWLAGLLYAGSGLGLAALLALRQVGLAGENLRVAPFARADLPSLAAAIAAGGVMAPVLFTFGLARTSGAAASLLLILETVLTVAIAWFAFREHRTARTVAGMALVVLASAVLGSEGSGDAGSGWGALLIALACLAWAFDNNLTRRIAGNDAMLIAAAKGLVGGVVNLGLATVLAGPAPPLAAALAAGIIGFFGYGVSLALFVIVMRTLGVARASAYYSTAPFVGVAVAFTVLGERPGLAFWAALPLMAVGVWLHLTERHAHAHVHARLAHAHPHRHDVHHRHAHDFTWDGVEPHTHAHEHEPLTHVHPHTPDLHHRHDH